MAICRGMRPVCGSTTGRVASPRGHGTHSSAKSSEGQLDQQLNTTSEENQKLKRELDELKRISSDAIDLHQRHQTLLHNHQLMQTELDVLKAENQRLQKDDRNTFFLYGAGAVGLGAIIALIAPSLRRRKRFSEWA